MNITPQSLAVLTLTFVSFSLLPQTHAVVPPPDGGYPGGNTAEGQNALLGLTTGGFNTAVGYFSLRANSTASFNTALGAGSLLANTGDSNTATGAGALLSNSSGFANTADGAFALLSNAMGNSNTATGFGALQGNTEGSFNTAHGSGALQSTTEGSLNTASGADALFHNTTGNNNTANGTQALISNTTGHDNTASGVDALFNNTTGFENTATGTFALNDSTGNGNTAMGFGALQSTTTGSYNVAIGHRALLNNTTGSFNVVLAGGANLLAGDFNIDIGNNGEAGDANTIRIGNPLHNRAFIAGISGVTVSGGTAVYIDSNGQLGTATSSARFKDEIKPMERASETLLALKPVTFHYKRQIDPAAISQFGLVAEDVEKVNPALVVRDKKGKPYSVRYDQVNAMLLNEFLKEHRRVEELKSAVVQQRKDFEAAITRQQKQTETLVARLNEQEARIQKVSAQVEDRRPTLRLLVENE
jgi:hypothetical protein